MRDAGQKLGSISISGRDRMVNEKEKGKGKGGGREREDISEKKISSLTYIFANKYLRLSLESMCQQHALAKFTRFTFPPPSCLRRNPLTNPSFYFKFALHRNP
jgi:hypothetical protein